MKRTPTDFDSFLRLMQDVESTKDRFLDAARLERHERNDTRMTGEQKQTVLIMLIILGSVLAFFGLFVWGTH